MVHRIKVFCRQQSVNIWTDDFDVFYLCCLRGLTPSADMRRYMLHSSSVLYPGKFEGNAVPFLSSVHNVLTLYQEYVCHKVDKVRVGNREYSLEGAVLTSLGSVLQRSSNAGTKNAWPKQLLLPRKKQWATTPIL